MRAKGIYGRQVRSAVQTIVFTEPELGCSYDDLAAAAQLTDRLAWHGFFCADHYLGPSQRPELPGPVDAWTTLAGLSRDTSRVRLGTLMTCATFRLPGPFAVTVAQVDAMSNGRIELGIGAGHFALEHEAMGVPFPPIGERFDRLTEQLEILTGLWSTGPGEVFAYRGKHYVLDGNPGLPKPRQQPYPRIIIGGRGPKRTPALAARFAAEMNLSYQSPDVARQSIQVVRDACERIGRDPATLDFSITLLMCCGSTPADVQRRIAVVDRQMRNAAAYRGFDDLSTFCAVGAPQTVVDRVNAYAELGVSRAYLHFRDLHDLEQLELFSAEVLPHLL
jgi:F420-dependent oxidoreductase-like protein